jgi:hypothetical protein
MEEFHGFIITFQRKGAKTQRRREILIMIEENQKNICAFAPLRLCVKLNSKLYESRKSEGGSGAARG